MIIPSRTLSRYMVRLFLSRFLGILIGLTAILQILDLLATADDVMAADGATWSSIASYVALRLPQLADQFTPFVALLASLLTLATLNQHSEVVVMKATGLSAHRILSPLGFACFFIAVSHFLFADRIVSPARATLDYWADNDFAVDLPLSSETVRRLWMNEDSTLILVDRASRSSGGRVILDGVTLFERDARGRLVAVVRADFAWHQNGRWTLHEVRRFDAGDHLLSSAASIDWGISTPPDRFLALKINPDHVTLATLWHAMEELQDEGLPTDRLMASLYQKIAGPAATILMPLLAGVAAFGAHRRGGLVLRVIFGMALGFAFFVADNFMLAMGEFGVAPPLLAAWAPFFLFLILGYAVLFLSEEGRSPAYRPPEDTAAGTGKPLSGPQS
ncbi:LPS export ABC transporter permease LptG [Eilatimonas milleporae]|nr:LPS export ABC transporter permease LptG [Eilatimonas milleporae]